MRPAEHVKLEFCWDGSWHAPGKRKWLISRAYVELYLLLAGKAAFDVRDSVDP